MKLLWSLLLWASLLAAQEIPDLYIVQLSGPPAATVVGKGNVRAASVDRRQAIRREQEAVRTALRARGADVVAAVDTVANALIVRAPGAQASDLAALAGVARVFPARRYHITLDHALPLHKVPEAWQILGGQDNAGAGMKIAMLDTGIDNTHPAFQDPALTAPDGFPKTDIDANKAFTNGKIIVARDYTGEGPQDGLGHGTGTAMAAAGWTNTGPLGPITGVAPKAWLGNYKVMDSQGNGSDTEILRALNDALLDGMDVVNLSLGTTLAPWPDQDPLVGAVETAAAAGMIVVVSAGNSGPDPDTIASPATAPSAIAVGASTSDRVPIPMVILDGAPPYLAMAPSGGALTATSASGPLIDLATVDPSGLACDALPAGSLDGKIPLILRGTCTFATKLNNAQAAGALAALIYTHADLPTLSNPWTAGTATLPAWMISYDDGLDIKRRLGDNPTLNVSVQSQAGSQVADFSSIGPNPDQAIKPDLLAVGTHVYTATETTNPGGELYDPSGYVMEDGTSYSSPIVAGAAALVKQARPGLTVQQYRSLLINSATPMVLPGGNKPVGEQSAGAGVLNVLAAVQDTVTAYPSSLSFGWGGATLNLSRDLRLTNIGAAPDTFTISVAPAGGGSAPSLSASSLDLGPGESQTVTLTFAADSLTSGEYQGAVQIQSAQSPVTATVPYWYGAASGIPKRVTILENPGTGLPDSTQRIYFRVTDSSGIPVPATSYTPEVTPVGGNGTVLGARPSALYPDAYLVGVQLSPISGLNSFQVTVGSLTATVQILSTRNP